MTPPLADVGVIGLAVMGRNLALNLADHGFRVAAYNRTTGVTDEFVAGHPDTPGGLVGGRSMEDLVRAVKTPRKLVVLVKSGPPVDALVHGLLDVGLEPGDIVVDCGNSLFTQKITEAYTRDPDLVNLMLDPFFRKALQRPQLETESGG